MTRWNYSRAWRDLQVGDHIILGDGQRAVVIDKTRTPYLQEFTVRTEDGWTKKFNDSFRSLRFTKVS